MGLLYFQEEPSSWIQVLWWKIAGRPSLNIICGKLRLLSRASLNMLDAGAMIYYDIVLQVDCKPCLTCFALNYYQSAVLSGLFKFHSLQLYYRRLVCFSLCMLPSPISLNSNLLHSWHCIVASLWTRSGCWRLERLFRCLEHMSRLLIERAKPPSYVTRSLHGHSLGFNNSPPYQVIFTSEHTLNCLLSLVRFF